MVEYDILQLLSRARYLAAVQFAGGREENSIVSGSWAQGSLSEGVIKMAGGRTHFHGPSGTG